MWQNYLKIGFRNLLNNRLYSGLNIMGLAVGLAVSLLMGLYVRDELSYDAFHEKADRLYRVNYNATINGQEHLMAMSCAPFGPTLAEESPAVEAMCRFRQWGFISVKKEGEAIEEGANTYVDSTFFQLFSFPLIEGDPRTALTEPGTMVISERIAMKYFGTRTGLLGQTLRVNERQDLRITGVMKNMPAQSHFHYDFLFPMVSIPEEANSTVWLSNNFQTYLLLRPGASVEAVAQQIEGLLTKYISPQLTEYIGSNLAEFRAQGNDFEYSLQNLRELHLHSDRGGEHEANSDIKYVWIFSAVALIVLLLACVNFMNLSTARSAKRAREVGVRKALGSSRGALVSQFLSESLLLTFISFGLAIVLVMVVLPYFNEFAAKDMQFSLLNAPLLVALGSLGILTALVAGSYPAFYLSSFRPIQTLKGKLDTSGRGASWLRSGLVTFQFFASVALIISVLTVQQQLSFIQNKKLGYDKEHLVMLRNTWWLQQKTTDFKAQLQQIPGVAAVSCSDYFPTPSSRNNSTFNIEGQDVAASSVSCQFWRVDFDYLNTLGLQLKEGRWFDAQLATDSTKCVINQAEAKSLGLANPIGHKITTYIDPELKVTATYEIIGIIEDFHYESLRLNIEPMVMAINDWSGTIALRLDDKADITQTLGAVKGLFKQYLPSQPFNYLFIDQEFEHQYQAEQRIGGILAAFAGLAIFIACLGLFGLAAYMAEQRTKEIGIRKVLGASITQLVAMLSVDFLKGVVVASLLAFPLAWWAMSRWLEEFAYRTELSWQVFVAAAVLASAIALVTVSAQSIKAALSNPVQSLRSE